MNIFRALNFRNLVYMIDPDLRRQWKDAQKPSSENWWFSDRHRDLKRRIVNYVIQKGVEPFVEESLYYTALTGGRWNLPRSHGILYCSENPLLSCLEVAYHELMGGLPHLRRMKRIEDKIRTSMNVTVPEELRFLIVVFVIELSGKVKETELDKDVKSIKSICNQAGFGNYTGHREFDKEFLFGNEYTVTQMIGAVIHGQRSDLIRVQSARTLENIKLVLPLDRAFDQDPYPVQLRPVYYEFDCRIEPLTSTSCFEFQIKARGQSAGLDVRIHLDRVPASPTARSSVARVFRPTRLRYSEKTDRIVVLQKYHLPTDCPWKRERLRGRSSVRSGRKAAG
jgi:hypothetical protein